MEDRLDNVQIYTTYTRQGNQLGFKLRTADGKHEELFMGFKGDFDEQSTLENAEQFLRKYCGMGNNNVKATLITIEKMYFKGEINYEV